MCYFIVLMSSLLLYNVENIKDKTLELEGVFRLLTDAVGVTLVQMSCHVNSDGNGMFCGSVGAVGKLEWVQCASHAVRTSL